MSDVKVHRHAARYLERLPKDTKERIKEVLKRLRASPLEQTGVSQMVGEWAGYYRIRVGKFRIIFWFDEKEDVVWVDYIGARGDVYK
jgi:mRNA interferase RelE/StbE